MNKLSILHIVPWFPNPENLVEGVFIQNHIKALNEHTENFVLHLRFGDLNSVELNIRHENINADRITIKPIINKWRFKELHAGYFVNKYLNKHQKKYDIVNFYIAYPNAISIHKLKKRFPNLKFCITEQWSAYHEKFNLPDKHKGRLRIENIFNHTIPLNVVSNALGDDIRDFSNQPNLEYNVIPNIIDDKTFSFQAKNDSDVFHICSINSWSAMKNPIVLLKAFSEVIKSNKNVHLTLAGSGQLDEKIKKTIQDLKLTKHVTQLGRINKKEVAQLLQASNAYCQSSNYETFSVICVEALACGTPVIATNIGGMKDFVNRENGILVDDMTPKAWAAAIKNMIERYPSYNKKNISETTLKEYHSKKVGKIFYDALKNLISEK